MPKYIIPEKGEMEIQGHRMSWEILRSAKPSVFGIQESRIYELNLYRDGTLTADYNKKWLRVPHIDDEASLVAINELVRMYGKEKEKRRKKEYGLTE